MAARLAHCLTKSSCQQRSYKHEECKDDAIEITLRSVSTPLLRRPVDTQSGGRSQLVSGRWVHWVATVHTTPPPPI